MTLVRKGLVRWYTHAFWYSLALIMSLMVMNTHLTLYYWAKVIVCFNLRVNARMGKYTIWMLYCFISLPTVENAIFSALEEYKSNMQTPNLPFFANPVSI